MQWIVGIDEAGRGPLAGPVAVGVVKTPGNFDWASKLPGVTDSKKLSEKKREAIYAAAKVLQQAGEIDVAVVMVGAAVIDTQGIVPAIKNAMDRGLRKLTLDPHQTYVKLDGSLKAPAIFQAQETIIKGDLLEPSIGLASIMAKVTRDRYMTRLAALAAYAPYNFHIHKGYGTKAHRELIAQFGLSDMHRVTYCQNIKKL